MSFALRNVARRSGPVLAGLVLLALLRLGVFS